MHPVMLLPDHADTSELRQALWRHRIGHRITDEADGQLLWIADPRQLGELKALLERWQRGEPLVLHQAAQRPRTMTNFLASLKQVPVTALMIVISLVVFA